MKHEELIDNKVKQLNEELDNLTDRELDHDIELAESNLNDLVARRNLKNQDRSRIEAELKYWLETKMRLKTLFVEPIEE